MSGPTAATFGLDAGLLIAYEATLAAAAIAEGYAAEDARRARLKGEREAERLQRRDASLAARHAMAEEIAREEARWQRLVAARSTLADSLGNGAATESTASNLPIRPAADDSTALATYLVALRAETAALARSVGELSARAAELPTADLAAIIATAPDLNAQLAAFEAQVRLTREATPAVAATRRAELSRILARAALAETATLPEELAALAAEMMRTLSDERAAALATELRLRVARHNEAATAAAAARVLEASLHDLGYEVDGIGETLFVEGGVAHFQKAGWNDYFVRLRVDGSRGSLNFNVVRTGSAGDDRSHEDLLAEERWCAEFPRLKETLAIRGIRVAVTRMLDAGQVPVQIVDAASLPRFATDGDERPHEAKAPKAMRSS